MNENLRVVKIELWMHICKRGTSILPSMATHAKSIFDAALKLNLPKIALCKINRLQTYFKLYLRFICTYIKEIEIV